MANDINRAWPKLREDLTLYPGPITSSGAPSWTLHDPARNQYFSIDWITFEVISRIRLGNIESIMNAIHEETTLSIEEESIQDVLTFLDENELIQRHDDVENYLIRQRLQMKEKSWFQSLLHGYLFFRVPLFKPDAWLTSILPYFSFVFKKSFLKITLIVFLMGLWGVYQQWEVFHTTFIDTFSLNGFIRYGMTLIGVKFIHELGHALVAKRHGCRVPTMGLAFLVMWPVAYTDVTESWKLNSHKKRLHIAGAGIATELVLAAWALFCWTIFPENDLRGLCFFLATTSITTTLLINASPFMRFDGYFLLCDFLGLPNLHHRCFAYTRWWFRKNLLNMHSDAPEKLSPSQGRFFIGFALVTMIYRLIVFTSIALLVYHYFFKVLGLILFGIEIWYFVMRPIWTELVFWKKHLKDDVTNNQTPPIYKWIFWIVLILCVPYDFTVNSKGVLKAEKSFSVITFQSSQVIKMPPTLGSKIEEGKPLMILSSLELEQKINLFKNRLITLSRQLDISGFDTETLSRRSILQEQLKSVQEELNGLEKERDRLKPIAPFTGEIVDVDPDLFINEWLPKNTHVVSMIDPSSWVIDTYITEADLKRIDIQHIGWFEPDAPGVSNYRLKVISIDRDASKVLNEGMLGSISGGDILVRSQNNKMIPENAIYHVRLKVDNLSEKISTGYLRGHVVILAWPKSIIGETIKKTLANLIREASF